MMSDTLYADAHCLKVPLGPMLGCVKKGECKDKDIGVFRLARIYGNTPV